MRKILSLALALCLTLSLSTVAFAEGSYSTNVKYVGLGVSEWELNVPTDMAPGETADVILSGTWDSTTTINVSADDKVVMRNDLTTDTKELGITFSSISQVGNMDDEIEVIEDISVADISGALFGTWKGIFNYSLTVNFSDVVGSAIVDGVSYDTLQEAIDNADNGDTVMLLSNVEESIVIAEGQEITLDLNGHNITGKYIEGVALSGVDNILAYAPISNKGTLTIKGSGVVDATTDAVPALYNEGTAFVTNGTYTRSNQFSNVSNPAGDTINSFYTILNLGIMTISDNANISTAGYYQSALANGIIYNESYFIPTTEGNLTVDGGTIIGGRHAITNNSGNMTINNGLIKSATHEKAKDAIGIDTGNVEINGGSIISHTGVAMTVEGDAVVTINVGSIIGDINAEETTTVTDNR